MRVAIVGSRSWGDYDAVLAEVEQLPWDTVVISGGADGADSLAREAAYACGLICVEVRPAWRDRNGVQDRAAGFKRNSVIVEMADRVIAFWDGKSNGTRDTIDKARAAGKPVQFITPVPART